MLLTFHTEGHLDRPPAGLLSGQQAELDRRAGRHFRRGEVPVLPADTPQNTWDEQEHKKYDAFKHTRTITSCKKEIDR